MTESANSVRLYVAQLNEVTHRLLASWPGGDGPPRFITMSAADYHRLRTGTLVLDSDITAVIKRMAHDLPAPFNQLDIVIDDQAETPELVYTRDLPARIAANAEAVAWARFAKAAATVTDRMWPAKTEGESAA